MLLRLISIWILNYKVFLNRIWKLWYPAHQQHQISQTCADQSTFKRAIKSFSMLSTETAVHRCSSKQVYFRNIHRKKLKAWRLFASCCLWKVDSLWKLSLEGLFALWKVLSKVKVLLFYWCRSSYWRCFIYTYSNFFFASHSLPLFLSWFLISAFIGKGVGFIFLISSLWLGLSIYFFFILIFFVSNVFCKCLC